MSTKIDNGVSVPFENLSTSDLLLSQGGFVEGHVSFRTNEHGNGFVEKMNFLKYPELLNEFGKRLAGLYVNQSKEIDWVIGPVHMGVVLASWTAYHLGKQFSLTYKEMRTGDNIETGSSHFHRSAEPRYGERVLFIDDFASTGNDVRRNVTFMKANGIAIVGVGLIGMRENVDFSDLDIQVKTLTTIPYWKVDKHDCKLCKLSEPIKFHEIRE